MRMSLADRRRIAATRDRRDWNREVREPLGFEQIIARFQAPYDDERRQEWVRRRLEEWRREERR